MPIQIFRTRPDFAFMQKRWVGFVVSIALTLGSLGLIVTKGLNLGIDFTGGILMEIHSEQPANLATLRNALSGGEFGEVSLQNSGSEHDVMIRIQVSDNDDQAKVVERVKTLLAEKAGGKIDYRKIDYVGPTVGKELVRNGMIATLLSFAAIMV